MLKNIMNTKINYTFKDVGSKNTVILLHGWGQNIEMMQPIANKLNDNYNILNIDLPGFGKSDEPDYAWSVYDYAKCINCFVSDLDLKHITIIGHSFGGRIGLIYASIYNLDKLICLGSPYCRELNKLPLKTRIYKFMKKISILKPIANIMKKYIGSTDYKNASEIMRGVLVKSINIDMIEDIKKINCPTLLIWGDKDTAVPINRAYELNKLIKNSKLIVYDNCTHYAYLEKLDEVCNVINDFIK